MTRTLVDVDDESLAAAAEELGTTTTVETINRPLRDIGSRKHRLALLDHLTEAEDDLGNAAVMDDAWD